MNTKKANQKCITSTYFPEVWYAIDNWLAYCKGKQILELGSGQGLFSVALSKANWKVNSVDNIQFAVNATKMRLKKEGFQESSHLIKAQSLPFPDRSFDGVVSVNFLEFQSAMPQIMAELARVLKSGGRAVIISLLPKTPWTIKSVASQLRPGDGLSNFKPLSTKDINALVSGTDLKLEKTVKLAKYLPLQFGKKPLPWFAPSINAYFCVKPEFTNEINFDSTQIHG